MILKGLLSWLAFPVYAWQGIGVRLRTERMHPAKGPVRHRIDGSSPEVRLLVIGDSSAAGVGVDSIEKCFAGFLPRFLAEKTGRPVTARIAGMNSATSAQIRDHVVPHVEPRDFDYVMLNIGTNDAKNFHTVRAFKRDFGTLIYALKARFPAATIVWAGVLDMEHVPALPSPLSRILGIRARLIDAKGKVLCSERGALAPVSTWRIVPENFSDDGFHASETGYREWAEKVSDFLIQLEQERRS